MTKILLFAFLLIIALSSKAINEDEQVWVEVPQDRLEFVQSTQVFNQVSNEAKKFWMQEANEQLGNVKKIQQLVLNRVQYYRITYAAQTVHEYDQVVITVCVDVSQAKKIFVTRSVPPVLTSDNIDGYISRY